MLEEIVKTLQNHDLEHHQPIKQRFADIIPVLGFIERPHQESGQRSPGRYARRVSPEDLSVWSFFKEKCSSKSSDMSELMLFMAAGQIERISRKIRLSRLLGTDNALLF